MFLLLGIVFLLLNLIVHEAAHAIAMMKYGVGIKKAGIGFPFGPKIEIRGLFSFPLTISLIMLGAYVEPSPEGEEKIKAMPYKDKAVIYGVGVIANLLMALLIIGIILIHTTSLLNPMLYGYLALLAAIGFVLVKASGIICRFVLPVIGSAVLLFILYSIFISNPASSTETQAIVGPVGIIAMVVNTLTLKDILLISADISLGIALINAAPLYPLDGGRIAQAIIEKFFGGRAALIFGNYSFVLILALVAMALIGDVTRLL